MERNITFDPLSITPQQLAEMQVEAMAKLPTVPVRAVVEANLRREVLEASNFDESVARQFCDERIGDGRRYSGAWIEAMSAAKHDALS